MFQLKFLIDQETIRRVYQVAKKVEEKICYQHQNRNERGQVC